ncbi:sensor histidine kinase [Tenacibaculum halocynthiae]|uniref:sensor histidine kinase n=1 Tax=Tenacibaculum halocynthiae TaxID=1254437 RepID=UPI003D64F109
MKNKITRLIIVSIISLLALSVIQGTLIKNTYDLKKENFINKAKEAISKIDDYTPGLDSLNIKWKTFLMDTLDEYSLNNLTKKGVVNELRRITDSINPLYIEAYNEELKKKKLDYNLKFHKVLKNITLVKERKKDTIFKGESNPDFKLLGSEFENVKELQVSNSYWHTERSFSREINKKELSVNYELHFESRDYINIDKWQVIVLGKMKLILILSLLIFLVVIALLYYSIKALITQKKNAEIKTDFINNITHELKTPLATLSLATKMLKKEEVKNKPVVIDSVINTIERQNTRLQKLIDQVLNNSLGYHEIRLNKQTIVIDQYLNTVLNDFLLSVESNKTSFERDCSLKNKIALDKFFVTTALFNILENAVKYGGTKINVSCRIENNKNLCISIVDNGIGISKKNQELLFDKFYRVDTSEIHDVKGLGLGLYYSNQIIKAHKGTILVESEKGKGTTFTIKIPV